MKTKVWFITGASQGFGRLLVEKLLAKNEQVVATSRTLEKFNDLKNQNFLGIEIKNLSDPKLVAQAVEQAKKKFGTIDVLVNNAGYGLMGNFESLSEQKIRTQFEVNVFAMMNVTRHILPIMRQNRSGQVINLSSIAGFVGYDQWSSYVATKFAVDGWSDALSFELKRFGIKITSVMPGPYPTEFLSHESLQTTDLKIADYQKEDQKLQEVWFGFNKKQAGNSDLGMETLIKLTELTDPPTHLFLGVEACQAAKKKNQEWKKMIEFSEQFNLEK